MKEKIDNRQELTIHQKFLEYIMTETNYTYVKTIHKGDHSFLYLLENRQTNELVVLKRLRKKKAKKEKHKKRFLQEQLLLKAHKRTEMPRFIHSGVVFECPFTIMEFITGDTYGAQKVSFNEAIDILNECTERLAVLLETGIDAIQLSPQHFFKEKKRIVDYTFSCAANQKLSETEQYALFILKLLTGNMQIKKKKFYRELANLSLNEADKYKLKRLFEGENRFMQRAVTSFS